MRFLAITVIIKRIALEEHAADEGSCHCTDRVSGVRCVFILTVYPYANLDIL